MDLVSCLMCAHSASAAPFVKEDVLFLMCAFDACAKTRWLWFCGFVSTSSISSPMCLFLCQYRILLVIMAL